MNHKKGIPAVLAILLLALPWGVYAATVSYILDRSEVLPDNVHYLTVTLSDDVEGQLDFWVNVESSLSSLATDNFGIQSFAFNLLGDLLPRPGRHPGWQGEGPDGRDVEREHRMEREGGEYGNHEAHERRNEGEKQGKGERNREREHDAGQFCRLDRMLTAESFILPEGWEVLFKKGEKVDGMREGFDVRLLGSEITRQSPLHFSVLGLSLDDIMDNFHALVAGIEFLPGECGEGELEHECEPITRAGIFGNTLVEGPVVVPLPAALWLFGSGLLGLAGIARRRRG